jgi:outer membrane biosynthesis protein TonB
VDVSFVIEPTGKVSSAGVSQAEFAGSTLDGCLSSTIRALQFPPISGGAQKINYPFNLQ